MTMPVPWSIANDSPICAAGMDVDARVAVGDLGQHARHQRHLAALELVRQPVDGGGEEAGVGEDHLVDGVRGRVAVADRLGVEQQRRADVREGGEEALDDIVRVGAVRLGQSQRVDQQRVQRGELVRHRARAAADLGGEVREQQLERAVDEALGELAQPRRQRVVLALAGELLPGRTAVPSRSGATAMLWTLAPELMRSFLAAVRHRLHPFLDLATPVAIAHRGGAAEAPRTRWRPSARIPCVTRGRALLLRTPRAYRRRAACSRAGLTHPASAGFEVRAG